MFFLHFAKFLWKLDIQPPRRHYPPVVKLSISDIPLAGKRVLMRVDFNVPLDSSTGLITNSARIEAALPTILHIINNGGSVVLMSHLGRPDGSRNQKFSLRPVADKLAELLGRPVRFLEDCVGPEVEAACSGLEPGDVVLLENLRFHIEEEGKVKLEDGTTRKADPEAVAAFRASLTRLGDIYANDAFGTAHRAHSSVVGVNLPIRVSGFLMQKELDAFSRVLDSPQRPLLAILGGAKIADKIPLIRNLLDIADSIIVGGGMAYTFKKVLDQMPIGASLFDPDGAQIIPELMEKARTRGVSIHLPDDFVIADKFAPEAQSKVISAAEGIPNDWMGLDIGPQSREKFRQVIFQSRTIVWNGPAGVFEFDRFAEGTRSLAQAIADATSQGATTVVGGGDTATAAKKFGIASKVTHVSTGGGASLELLEGKTLPGVAALTDKS